MICLGIESTAHTFGVGVFDGKARANEKAVYRTMGGIHPREASQFMCTHAAEVAEAALEKAGIGLGDVDAFAFAQGPGLGPCLRVGAAVGQALAGYYGKPVVGVNHCVAHIDVGKWNRKARDPLVAYVSGANTQILGLNGGRYRVYGETLDIGMGNALDVFGRSIGLEFPAGPAIEKLAAKGKKFHFLPYSVKGMDLAFAGLVTAASKSKIPRADLCHSFQETVFAMLVEVSERALAHTKKEELMLVGGVAQNKRLGAMLSQMAEEHGAKFFVPENQYNADNGLMIALTGWKMLRAKVRQGGLKTNQKWRTDEVAIAW
ncbi:MAG: tRNA (adenosine(37)-N6)-threonylcarbamoyltransferase complex transferase subunit TsaD [Candidatus Diapherotrites archaeon]|nr:tRNA (adenosine(37)-N6)-threonylcarbamoyltransferase complex transferase subunit TsaD [Candidatus Diapherotrites archaeon]